VTGKNQGLSRMRGNPGSFEVGLYHNAFGVIRGHPNPPGGENSTPKIISSCYWERKGKEG